MGLLGMIQSINPRHFVSRNRRVCPLHALTAAAGGYAVAFTSRCRRRWAPVMPRCPCARAAAGCGASTATRPRRPPAPVVPPRASGSGRPPWPARYGSGPPQYGGPGGARRPPAVPVVPAVPIVRRLPVVCPALARAPALPTLAHPAAVVPAAPVVSPRPAVAPGPARRFADELRSAAQARSPAVFCPRRRCRSCPRCRVRRCCGAVGATRPCRSFPAVPTVLPVVAGPRFRRYCRCPRRQAGVRKYSSGPGTLAALIPANVTRADDERPHGVIVERLIRDLSRHNPGSAHVTRIITSSGVRAPAREGPRGGDLKNASRRDVLRASRAGG
jgi:hypothetical protein